MVGNARHRDRFARGCAALGQRDIQQLRRTFGIVIKQFVKVAHAVKQQDLRVLSLQLKILLHHGVWLVKSVSSDSFILIMLVFNIFRYSGSLM